MYACGAADAGAGVALLSMEGKKALGVKYLKNILNCVPKMNLRVWNDNFFFFWVNYHFKAYFFSYDTTT